LRSRGAAALVKKSSAALGIAIRSGQNPRVPVTQENCVKQLVVFVLLIGLGACSTGKPEEGRAQVQSGAPGPVVGSAAPGAPSTGGSAPSTGGAPSAGAVDPAGSSPTGELAATIGCATQVNLVCDDGFRDGCTGGLTAVHVCVAADAKAGPPCAQEVALACPAGQIDACLRSPPLANHHVCMVVPKPTP
jgi:hypothetical protein